LSKKKAESYLNINSPEEPYIEPKAEIVKSQDELAAEFGFYQDTIRNLFDGLNTSINSNEPFFIWSKRRQNEKMKLNNEKLVLIYDQIKNLRAIAEEFLELKADAIFSSEYLKNLVQDKFDLATRYFEIKKEEHKTRILAEKAKREHIGHDLTDREIAQQKEKAIIRRLEGEAKQANAIAKQEEAKAVEMKANARLAKYRAQLAKIATGELKFSELPKSFQTFIVATIIKADPNKLNDFEISQRVNDYIIQEAKAEADKKTAEAEDVHSEARHKKYRYGQTTADEKDTGL